MNNAGQVTITLNEQPCVAITPDIAAALAEFGETDVGRLNRLDWRHGASRWSEGHFLGTLDTVYNLRDDAKAGRAIVVTLTDPTDPAHGKVIASRMNMLAPRPLHLGNNEDTGLYDVCLVDDRYFWQGNLAFSAGNTNDTTTADRSTYYDASMNGASPWMWTQLINYLLADLGIGGVTSVTMPTSLTGAVDPTDYLVRAEPAALTLDRVCAALGLVFLANWGNATGKAYQIGPPSSFTGLTDIEDAAIPKRWGGGKIYNAGEQDGRDVLNLIMPASVTVVFPRESAASQQDSKANTSAPPINQFFTLSSTAGKPTDTTGRAGYSVVLHDTVWAIGPAGAETNLTALQARADFLAGAYYQRFRGMRAVGTLHGWRAFGMWAGYVSWMLTTAGPFTIYRADDDWWGYGGDRDGGTGLLAARVTGLGTVQTYKGWSGELFIAGRSETTWGTLTGHTGRGPLAWGPYQFTLDDGTSVNATNSVEDNGVSATIIQGTPGSLGATVDSGGGVNAGSCHVQPIGPGGRFPLWWDAQFARWSFTCANSAQ